MSYGNPVTSVTTPPAAGIPFFGAQNGVSQDPVSSKVELGQAAAGVTGIAALTNNRNIPAGAFQVNVTTNNIGGAVGGRLAVLSATSGATGNIFVANNVNISGALPNGATRSNCSSQPTWRISGGTNFTMNGYLMQPDFRPTGGDGVVNGFNSSALIVSPSGNGPYASVAFNATHAVTNNNINDLTLRGFYYRIPTLYTGSGVVTEIAFENTQGDNYFNSDAFALGIVSRSFFGVVPGNSQTTAAVEINGTIAAGNPGGGYGAWKLGKVRAGVVALDTANYVEVEIDGVVIKLLKAA